MTPDGLVVTPVGKPQNGDMEKISETIPNPTRKGGFYRWLPYQVWDGLWCLALLVDWNVLNPTRGCHEHDSACILRPLQILRCYWAAFVWTTFWLMKAGGLNSFIVKDVISVCKNRIIYYHHISIYIYIYLAIYLYRFPRPNTTWFLQLSMHVHAFTLPPTSNGQVLRSRVQCHHSSLHGQWRNPTQRIFLHLFVFGVLPNQHAKMSTKYMSFRSGFMKQWNHIDPHLEALVCN